MSGPGFGLEKTLVRKEEHHREPDEKGVDLILISLNTD